jgi:capsular exopolysaccharide synthesis family protein
VLLLAPNSTESLVNGTAQSGSGSPGGVSTEAQIQIIQSKSVTDAVTKRIGSAPPISITQVGATEVLRLSALSPRPSMAANIANTYASAYIDVRRGAALDDLTAAGQQVQAKIDDLQRQLDALPPASPGPGKAADPAISAEHTGLIAQQEVFKQRLNEIQVQTGVNSAGAQIITPASVPTVPVKPTPIRNGLIAGLAGLVLGLGLAFLLDHLDDSIKSKDQLERSTNGVSTLGIIPAVEGWKTGDAPRIISLEAPTSSASEAYRALRTAIQFMGLDRPIKTIQVTSPSAAEGKTTTIANLAVALASAGQRVVMVDCDLRRPRIHAFFGRSNELGFTSVLLGPVSLTDALQRVHERDRLMLLASGVLPPNPSELLSSRRTGHVLAALQAEADVVLIDSPPVLPVTDAAVLSGRVDVTLLVTRAGVTTGRQLSRAVEVLQQVDAPLVGVVLNGVSAEDAYGYDYRYRYYQQDEKEKARRPAAADRL